jgi:hypothetical protein
MSTETDSNSRRKGEGFEEWAKKEYPARGGIFYATDMQQSDYWKSPV